MLKSSASQIRRYGRIAARELLLRMNGSYTKKQSVSFCTPVKNRLEHLQQTVLANLEDNKHYPNLEIVILNYACSNPETERWVKKHLARFIESGRVNYYFYPDTKTFDYSHAKNLAHRLATGEIICNVDADNFTGPGFAEFCSAQLADKHSFLSGPRDGRGLGGRIALRREHFYQTGGYDERIVDWGGCDYELTLRLGRLALKNRPILIERYLEAISHSDELRTHYSAFNDKWETSGHIESILNENEKHQVLNPNRLNFGCGRVQKNFRQWITVGNPNRADVKKALESKGRSVSK